MKLKIAQSSLTLCNLMDCSLWGSFVHTILQARILEWVTMLSSRGSSQPRNWTQVSPYCRWILYRLSHQGSPAIKLHFFFQHPSFSQTWVPPPWYISCSLCLKSLTLDRPGSHGPNHTPLGLSRLCSSTLQEWLPHPLTFQLLSNLQFTVSVLPEASLQSCTHSEPSLLWTWIPSALAP